MVGHGGSSAGSYLADPTSPIPSHCASIVVTSTLRVNMPMHWDLYKCLVWVWQRMLHSVLCSVQLFVVFCRVWIMCYSNVVYVHVHDDVLCRLCLLSRSLCARTSARCLWSPLPPTCRLCMLIWMLSRHLCLCSVLAQILWEHSCALPRRWTTQRGMLDEVTLHKKHTIHQVTTKLPTSKNVLFSGHNQRYWWPDTLIIAWAPVRVIIKVDIIAGEIGHF